MKKLLTLLATLSVGLHVFPAYPNAQWKYLDNSTKQGTHWRTISYDDFGWKKGNAELRYGDGTEAILVTYIPSANN